MINKYLRIKKLFIKVLLLLPLICIGFGGSKGKTDKFHFEILLLACCYIDAIASVCADEKEVGKRFIEILIRFGTTNGIEFSKVNLIFLHEQMRKYRKMKLPKKCQDWLSSEIEKRDYSAGDNTEFDLTEKMIFEILISISTDEEKRLYGDTLKDLIKKSMPEYYTKIVAIQRYGKRRCEAIGAQ